MSNPADGGTLRLDLWLWYARFFKTRSLATRACLSGKIRVNKQPMSKAHAAVRPGDVLTFPQGRHIRVVRVVALAARRGPAAEAQGLYDDLAPPSTAPPLPRDGRPQPGGRRPTKADRRAIDRMRGEI